MESFAFILLSFLSLTVVYCQGQSSNLQLDKKPTGYIVKGDGSDMGKVLQTGSIYRLNDIFIPLHYKLEVKVILDKGSTLGSQHTAPGKVKIVGVIKEHTNKITLHSSGINIYTGSITITKLTYPNATIPIIGTTEDNENQIFTIEMEQVLEKGEEYEIYIEYVTQIIESFDAKGLFRRTYQTEDNEPREIAVSHFEAIAGRRMFPCFDEPHLKATFEVTVVRMSKYISLSNTELVSSTPDLQNPGWVIDRFARSVKMSTYLVAISVNDYAFTEDFFGNKPARMYAPTHIIKKGGGNYAVKCATKVLQFYENYFNETYKLSKIDLVAVPELRGMNTYGTSYITFFPGETTESSRRQTTKFIAHELAHQWFGNLVTLKWWDEAYLNEGLTSYMQYLGMEAISHDMMALEYSLIDSFQHALESDAFANSTHPLSHKITSNDQIDKMFSSISYEKGASVIRMVESFISPQTLRKAFQSYVKKASFDNVQQEDLFASLQAAAVADNKLPQIASIPEIMYTWTTQTGFPVVYVDIINATHVQLSQRKFLSNGDVESNSYWYIPITIISQESPNLQNNIPQLWLKNDGASKVIQHNTSQWIMINQNATGYYRVQYDDFFITKIQTQLELNAHVFSPLSRAQLLDDYFVFANQNLVSFETTLSLTQYLTQETHFTVWTTFFRHFLNIYTKFSSHPGLYDLKNYIIPKLESGLLSIGLHELPSHTGSVGILRAELLDWTCSLESTLCYEYATYLLSLWQATGENPIKFIDARPVLICAMVANGGKDAFNFIWSEYAKSKIGSPIRSDLLSSLACTRDESIMIEFLTLALRKGFSLSDSDVQKTFTNVIGNPGGRSVILQFLSNNIENLIEKFGNGTEFLVSKILTNLAGYTTTEETSIQIRYFLEKYVQLWPAISNRVLQSMQQNIAWMDSPGQKIWTWMKINNKP